MKHTLLILDDHSIVRKGLKTWIESVSDWKVVALTETVNDTLAYFEETAKTDRSLLPEIAIFDIQLSENEMSFDLLKTVARTYPEIKPVIYTMFDTTGFILMAKEQGAKGYVSKSQEEETVLECLETVSAGGEFFALETHAEEKISRANQILKLLTKQQRRVYEEILMGKSNEEIAQTLGVKVHSVENYINKIYEKLDIFSREDILHLR